MMRVNLLLVGVVLACFGLPFRATADDAAVEKELKALVGTWETEIVVGTKKFVQRFMINADGTLVEEGTGEYSNECFRIIGTFAFILSKKTKRIDRVVKQVDGTESGEEYKAPIIYELKRDQLKVGSLYDAKGEHKTPTDFSNKDLVVKTYKRVKK